MKNLPPKPMGKSLMPDNFNRTVDTREDLFGKRDKMSQRDFRSEIFLNLNILTRPAGPTVKITKTKVNSES